MGQAIRTKATTVLVVDDDPAIRTAVAELLRDEGYVVICAANGEEALQQLSVNIRPDLVLLDLMMPVLSGWEVLEVLRDTEALSHIPVVAVSAMNAPGVRGHIPKPIDVPNLLATVARLTA